MEQVYVVRGPGRDRKTFGYLGHSLCAVSCRNLVAVSTTYPLQLDNGKVNESESLVSFEAEYNVYVFDVDRPWEVYHVVTMEEAVCQLVWDIGGSHLLVIDKMGTCQVLQMKDYLINSWECVNSMTIPGEEVLSAAWLHSGIQVQYNVDKREKFAYDDIFRRAFFTPSLSHFGGSATDGFIVVTATGLVCVGFNAKDEELHVTKSSLSTTRSRIQHADIAFSQHGEIIILTSDGMVTSSIQCYKVALKMKNNTCTITSKAHASFFTKCHSDASFKESQNRQITHVVFACHEDPDSIIVCAEYDHGSCIELWHTQEQPVGLHAHFQSSVPQVDQKPFKMLKWNLQATVLHNSPVSSIATSSFPIIQSMTDSTPILPKCLVVGYKDGLLKLLNQSTFKVLVTHYIDSSKMYAGGEPPEKRKKPTVFGENMQLTYTGCGLVMHDNQNRIRVLKLLNTKDPITQVPMSHVVSLLEYCILTGYDWWDVLLTVKPGAVDSVIQKLTENFSNQPHHLQELLYTRFLAVKASLYRSTVNGQTKAQDCYSKLLLASIATAFKTILRPKHLSGQDKSPSEKLSMKCTTSESDLDSMMLNLDTKEFKVENTVLQSLQQLIQWVADFTLYVLASVPIYQSCTNIVGASIMHDRATLGTLREMLVIIRIWGLLNPSCLPVFTTMSASLDCMALLFKLLTKLWIAENPSMEFEDSFIDECCLLPSQVLVPNLEQANQKAVPTLVLIGQQHNLEFDFNKHPEHLDKLIASKMPEIAKVSQQKRDIVRQIQLGVSPSEAYKHCSRCGSVSLINVPSSSISANTATKAWDERWTKTCLCGGHWKHN